MKLKWLHLSDLHIGMTEQGWMWPNVSAILLADIERQVARLGGIDLVIFSGDLVQSGLREEFDKLDKLLSLIWACLRNAGCNPPLFTIPGNHDLKRPPKAKAPLLGLKAGFHRNS